IPAGASSAFFAARSTWQNSSAAGTPGQAIRSASPLVANAVRAVLQLQESRRRTSPFLAVRRQRSLEDVLHAFPHHQGGGALRHFDRLGAGPGLSRDVIAESIRRALRRSLLRPLEQALDGFPVGSR